MRARSAREALVPVHRIGEAGPGPSYLDEGSGGPENDFTNRNTTFMTWNLLHLAKLLKDSYDRWGPIVKKIGFTADS